MTKYKVMSPLEVDNQRIEPGRHVELDDTTAAPLLAVGCIEAVSINPVRGGGGGKSADAEAAVGKGKGK